ncbi:unnamed protein product [Commensalibacter communis]|uniref:hypothetical protein n=1 Tax=Commensalibacter communis TaxID=2972786 RepID=UPI0022FF5292|nr:hypothetical protein [Commensalibacter communis]CAI3926087.1 unnamed protein product [Commensalibacter communis]CAI3933038.1 unnamed protein product [Commensalibacter communis]
MIYEDLFAFKLQLKVGLTTFKEVQDWADQKILQNNNDAIILDICFIKSHYELQDYLDHLFKYDVDVDKEKVALVILKQYFNEKVPKQLDSQLRYHVSILRFLADYLDEINLPENEASLISRIIAYEDEIILSEIGDVLSISVEEIYAEFYQYLQNWLSKYT